MISLLQVDVPVLSNSECNALFKQAGLDEHVSDDIWVCAGYREGGKDACDVSLSGSHLSILFSSRRETRADHSPCR